VLLQTANARMLSALTAYGSKSLQHNTSKPKADELQYCECQLCGKKCYGRNRKQNLAHHMVTHNNDRNLACTLCPYRASFSSQLLRHVTQVHSAKMYEFPFLNT
ncbi:Zinc finger C2H2-type, partial [Trinorchestia longiramus]